MLQEVHWYTSMLILLYLYIEHIKEWDATHNFLNICQYVLVIHNTK